MRLFSRVRYALSAALFLAASLASARVISYAPYTNRTAHPLEQARTNRYFALYEQTALGEIVLYDTAGAEEPRVIYPTDGGWMYFYAGAVHEKNGVASILLLVQQADTGQPKWVFSSDSGKSWKTIDLPLSFYYYVDGDIDTGGPFTHARFNSLRVGNDATPFVFTFTENVYAIDADGSTRVIYANHQAQSIRLAGRNRDGTKFILRTASNGVATLSVLGIEGSVAPVTTIADSVQVEGWIASANALYLERRSASPSTDHRIVRFDGAVERTLVQALPSSDPIGVLAIPTFDYDGAWIIQRGVGKPTTLYHQSLLSDPVVQWIDVSGPEVEALHAGASGNTLLIQVHRARAIDATNQFIDPALAIWHSGDGAPAAYDELFMNEQTTKGFVHLDVDKVAGGEPFVFDSGLHPASAIPVSAPLPAAGGSDVLQEWGVVRASLAQKLVLPGMARTHGVFDSYWQSDVVIYNPASDPQNVRIDYVATGNSFSTSDAKTMTLTLAGKEIRVIPDALKALFNVDSGGGAFFITPDGSVNVTSRTYTTAANGTYGFSMNGIDFLAAAASPRFPVTFAGAFPGPNFRTNVVITDTSGRGTEAVFSAAGALGSIGNATPHFSAPPNGQVQMNSITPDLGIFDAQPGALIVQPTRGTAIASVIAIDNRTNDPTYFPPDLSSSVFARTIPAIGHLDGANGAKYRSDLYLYNPSTATHTVLLQAKAWDTNESPTSIQFSMLPGEARIIPDALFKLFAKSGIARLRYQTTDLFDIGGLGIRVTSRTYSVDDNGGTYGFLMPPFNNFQIGGSGDTLEILGVVGGKGFRTNLGLVECTQPNTQLAPGPNVQARIDIIDDKGKTIDSFTMNVPPAGGVQINDIFHARGLGDGPIAALIRITPLSGLFGAYATMNDNGTNDPTYLAANLAATN
jgi:ribosomal protein L25 (general stress protein Ctc)